jgi:hypothetical protein
MKSLSDSSGTISSFCHCSVTKMAIKKSELYSSLWAGCDELRGGILTDMDEEINALETKLTKARQIKQGMMHNLLTGKTRLV